MAGKRGLALGYFVFWAAILLGSWLLADEIAAAWPSFSFYYLILIATLPLAIYLVYTSLRPPANDWSVEDEGFFSEAASIAGSETEAPPKREEQPEPEENENLEKRLWLKENFEPAIQEMEAHRRREVPLTPDGESIDEERPDNIEFVDDTDDIPHERGSLLWALLVLGISGDDIIHSHITTEDLNKFYRLRSMLYHPDKYLDQDPERLKWADGKMAELNEARDIVFSSIEKIE